MATSIWQSEFESLFEAFTEGLDNKDAEDLKKISFKELQTTIGDIQEEQHHLRRLQNLARLEPFLEATKQFSAVVQLFCNNNDVVTFIWASHVYGTDGEYCGRLLLRRHRSSFCS